MLRERELEASPAPSGRVETGVVTDAAGFAALRLHWDALMESSDASVFNSWSWLYPWYRRIAADRAPFILTARGEHGELLGVLPLCVEVRRALGKKLRRLSFLGETHVGSDYLDVVAPRGREAEVARLFARQLRALGSEWDVLDLVDLSEASVTLTVFGELFGDHRIQVSPRFVCPYQPLTPGEPFDDFLKRTARRDNFLRRKKWLEKQPGYRIEVAERPGQLAAPLEEFFRLHRMRWAADGGSQGIKGTGVEAFHRDATQLLAENDQLRLYSLKLGAKTLASVYGIVHQGRFVYFQSGYDPEWRSKSVGLVLVGKTFEDALDARCAEYDFLRGTESYKSDWTTSTRRTVALRVHPAGGVGERFTRQEALSRGIRNGFKAILPASAVEWIRRARRRRAAVA